MHNRILKCLLLFIFPLAKISECADLPEHWPLSVGNYWELVNPQDLSDIYRIEVIDQITKEEKQYFVISNIIQHEIMQMDTVRVDSNGCIWRHISSKDYMWFDFTKEPAQQYEIPNYLHDTEDFIITPFYHDVCEMFSGKLYWDCISYYFDEPTPFDEEFWYTFSAGTGPIKFSTQWTNYEINDLMLHPVNTQVCETYTPLTFHLYQNYPNPFNSCTNIRFRIDKPSKIELLLFNLKGQLLNTLMSDFLTDGEYTFTLNLAELSSSTYFFVLKDNLHSEMKRMIYLK
jgi:hypothetical protein